MSPFSEIQSDLVHAPDGLQNLIIRFNSIKGYFLADRSILNFVKHHPGNGNNRLIREKITAICHEEWMLFGAISNLSSHIQSLPMRAALREGDLGIVSQIAKGVSFENSGRYYDFASRYCAIHSPQLFPVWSPSALAVIACYASKKDAFDSYHDYAHVGISFRKNLGLKGLNYMEINKFFWLYEDALINGV